MKKIIILGAGPAGLSAGLELTEKGYSPIILEKDCQVGGMAKTVEFKGYRFDLGPHRFFSKSKEINDLWKHLLGDDLIEVERLTRIYHHNKFFYYPVKLTNVISTMGLWQSFLIGLSYLKQKIRPHKDESTFEKWVSNRFGSKLYEMFFKNYTAKLWGVDPKDISADWAAQRIKGLSISSALKKALFPKRSNVKSLIESFSYPKYGAGMMFEAMADKIRQSGGEIRLNEKIIQIKTIDDKFVVVTDKNEYQADKVVSSIPFTLLFNLLSPAVPDELLNATKQLRYRSNIEVNLILKGDLGFKDNWIYLHDPSVNALRLVNGKNWGRDMNPDDKATPISMEYFCNENDELWNKDDKALIDMAVKDITTLRFSSRENYIDGFVVRNPKSYPVYFGDYQKHLDILKDYLIDNLDNMQVIGRYGMYKYNNMDHSIMTGLCAARNIVAGKNIYNIWEVNVDTDYQEEKS